MSATMLPTANGAQSGNPMQFIPNLSKDVLDQTLAKYQQMRQDGVRDDDPDMIKARTILSAATQHNEVQKQRMLYQQQMAAAKQSTPQNAAGRPQNLNGLGSPGLADGSLQNAQGTPSSNSAQAQPNGQAMSGSLILTKEQQQLLKHQMYAYRLLIKNAPVPPEIQRACFPSKQLPRSPTPREVLEAVDQALDRAASGQPTENGAPEDISHRRYETYTSPHDLIKGGLAYSQYTMRKNRLQIPSLMPPGVDVERIRVERENIVYNRIMARRQELEKLHAGIAVWDTSKSAVPKLDDAVKKRAFIEYKKLCLLPKQRMLRQQVSREIVQFNNLAMTVNRALYRRNKKHLLREAKFTEKLEKEQRDARETKEKQKHNDHMRAILKNGEEIRNAGQEQKARVGRLGRLMLTQHQTIERDEQKRVERTAKQRLQALKANDEETYLKLLGQAKDSRISHLIKQTDGFLGELAASVKDQQRSSAQRWGEAVPPEESPEPEDDDDGGKKIDYYEVAHRIKEEVTAQSSNLVGGTLKEYQLKGLQWMISLYNNNLNGILADEMGLGKTIQTISLITYLIEKKRQQGPYLVIVPLSTLTNWHNEFEKWAPTVQRIVYKGPPNSRKVAQNQIRSGQFQVLLTTYEFIIKDRPILSKVKWMHMIVDEGHRMKNAQSKLSSTITQYYNTRYRIILTGTPLQNSLPELWAILNFVLPTIFKSVKSFDEWFNTPFANTGGQDKMDLTEEEQLLVIRRLHKVLRPFLLRRLKKDVEKDLPDKQERVVKCNFSSLQAKLYNQLLNHNMLMVSDGKGGKTGMRGLSNMLMQLRKLCNHPFVFEEVEDQINPTRTTNDLLWRTSGKFELLDRILPKFRATGHRVLMFFQMTQIMNIMEDFMRLRGFEYLRLDGSTKSDERADLLKLFNAENSPYFCFLLSTRAGGLGLNLQTADTVIIYDSDWNPHQDLQAQDRAHRIGQKNEVRILRLISSKSVEEKILERAQFKLDMDGKVIQAGRFDNKSTEGERDAMLRVMLESAEAAENLETEEMDDDDLNMMMIRSEDELAVFQKIDAERNNHPTYGPGKKLPRLFSEGELPDIYMTDDNPVVEEIEENVGRGARERTRVKYDDGLTEEQWLDAVDNDEDTVEDAIARKNSRKAKRQANKDARTREESVAETPPATRESSESPAPKKRSRPSKGKATAEKRKADEASLDSEAPMSQARKRGRNNKSPDALTPEERSATQKVLDKVYDALMELEEPATGPDNESRGIIDLFIELPNKEWYPDYYQYIKNPICMNQIQRKINRKEYPNLNAFASDLQLLCQNCRTYNEDGSGLYHDANLIEKTTLDLLRSETSTTPALGQAAYKDGVSNGALSGPPSGVATPAASSIVNGSNGTISGQKLKLNLGGAGGSAAGNNGHKVNDDDD